METFIRTLIEPLSILEQVGIGILLGFLLIYFVSLFIGMINRISAAINTSRNFIDVSVNRVTDIVNIPTDSDIVNITDTGTAVTVNYVIPATENNTQFAVKKLNVYKIMVKYGWFNWSRPINHRIIYEVEYYVKNDHEPKVIFGNVQSDIFDGTESWGVASSVTRPNSPYYRKSFCPYTSIAYNFFKPLPEKYKSIIKRSIVTYKTEIDKLQKQRLLYSMADCVAWRSQNQKYIISI